MSNKQIDKAARVADKAKAKVASIEKEIGAKEIEIRQLRAELAAAKTAVADAEKEHAFAVFQASSISAADLKAFVESRNAGASTNE